LDMTLACIHVLRNPLDIVISYAHFAGHEIDHVIEQIGAPMLKSQTSERSVYEYIGSWSTHVAGWMSISHRPVHVLRYEDMLAAPQKAFGGLARFLRLEPSREQLSAAINNSSFSALSEQESANGFVEKPPTAKRFFRAGRSDQWRDMLSNEQIQKVISAHAPMMQRAGYLPPNCGADIIMSAAERRGQALDIVQLPIVQSNLSVTRYP
jgi:hypothetical protein